MSKKTIAVCIADIDEHYNDSFLRNFRDLAKKYDYNVLYFYSFSAFYFMDSHDLGEKNIFQLINYNMLDAVVVFPLTFTGRSFLEEIIENATSRSIPVISIDQEKEGCISLCFDETDAMDMIISHVLEEHDVKHVNFISGGKEDVCGQRRLETFCKCMEAHGREVEEERIGYGDFWHEPTIKVMDRFMASDLPFPDAIICANDSMAITVYDYLTKRGYKVPGDVIVTGYDGILEALHHTPTITTARRDIAAASAKVFELLDRLFQGEQLDDVYMMEPETMLYGTCGCKGPEMPENHYNDLIRGLYGNLSATRYFLMDQIRMSAYLTKADDFMELFEDIKECSTKFTNKYFAICIVDDFVVDEEFSDIVENTQFRRTGYSSHMNRMLYRKDGEWQGIIDFATKDLLPDLEEILEDCSNLYFFPLHIHDQTIGYGVMSYSGDDMEMIWCYQFFMNISNALDMTKNQHRQRTIIQNLENKYIHDPLTGLYNRRGFYQHIKRKFRHCVESGTEFMLLSIDLNGLKIINDTYGHADGDIAISTLARALQNVAGPEDSCARFGGDEFVAAGPVGSNGSAGEFVQKIRDYLKAFNETSGKEYEVDASIGVVTLVPDSAITLEEILKEADVRMYEEKVRHHKQRK